jgi:NAD(P)H-dependent FMN reductase
MHRITIISGSVRLNRQTPKAVAYLSKSLLSHPNQPIVTILDIKDFNFPIMEERRGRNPNPPDRLDEFGEVLENSDAFVFASPEYNGSISGALKNTCDYFYKEYRKKPAGVLTVSGGTRGGINASHDLQKYLLALGTYPMPYKLMVANVRNAFAENGDPIEERLTNSFKKFSDELLWLTEAIVRQKDATKSK